MSFLSRFRRKKSPPETHLTIGEWTMYVVQDAAKNRRLVKAKRPADALIQFRDSVPANVQTPPIRVYLAEEYLERPVPVLEQPENS